MVAQLCAQRSAVTYTFSGGRFGDCLLSYCHAKWIAYLYNIPLLYKPFDYSHYLMMHTAEIRYTPEREKEYNSVIEYTFDTRIDPHEGCLYVIPFFPESIFNRLDKMFPYLFTVNWADSGFKTLLQKMISPMHPFTYPRSPKDAVSVAVHIRKGTGWDIPMYRITPEALTASHPLRFAPDSFFIAQLKKIVSIFKEKEIYVYLFTDHDNPAVLAEKYQRAVGCKHMTFDYRTTTNNEFVNVLEDFFALTHFDCLIRSDSNFSFMAGKLANYSIQISPWHGVVNEGKTIIDEICCEFEGKMYYLKEYIL